MATKRSTIHFNENEQARVARGYIFIPKLPIWESFGEPWNGKCWYILWPIGIFYGPLKHCTALCNVLWLFGIFSLWKKVARKFWQHSGRHGCIDQMTLHFGQTMSSCLE
jgi:hypothetical protein